jgi:oligosaccharide repeat unit polymerase
MFQRHSQKKRAIKNPEKVFTKNLHVKRLNRCTYVAFWICFIVCLFLKLYIIYVKLGISYEESYITVIDFPVIFNIPANLFSGTVFIFLASKPSKRKRNLVLFLYLLVEGVLDLFVGNRMAFATTLLTIFVLYVFDMKKLKRKTIFAILCAGTAMIVLFVFIEFARGDARFNGSFFDILIYFFDSVGGSGGVIANTIYYMDQFPKAGYVYFFSPMVTMFTDNNFVALFVSIITGRPIQAVPAQGAEFLQRYNFLDHWLTSIVNYDRYLAGHGMGGSYIADSVFAFGVLGVIIVGIFLAWLMYRINSIDKVNGIFKRAFLLFLLVNLFALPRNNFAALFSGLPSILVTFLFYGIIIKIGGFSNVEKEKNSEK